VLPEASALYNPWGSRLTSQEGDAMKGDSERAALMQRSRDWARVATSGDLEPALSFWSDDAIVMPPGQPAIVGKSAIRDFLRQTMAIPGFSITWEPEHASVANDADVGYMVERNRITFTDGSGATQTRYGKAVTVWRKDDQGAWRCVVDTWNDNPTERVLPE
jgi:ketosteroid isomerase-like protein